MEKVAKAQIDTAEKAADIDLFLKIVDMLKTITTCKKKEEDVIVLLVNNLGDKNKKNTKELLFEHYTAKGCEIPKVIQDITFDIEALQREPERIDIAEFYNEMADKQLEKKDYLHACDNYEEVFKVDPYNRHALYKINSIIEDEVEKSWFRKKISINKPIEERDVKKCRELYHQLLK
ncbi:hypothetical protein MBAV_003743 [Candidatus Magnetobacterium bavaricum]|uniref:Uncharacterized protein n=1 Tax=Candidatus Magnetobacterium bavaricum TaxID=29290 RepID=A0A0F3GQG9_9BACT|nr:hypothetical protein MBAV_003743 [Candidatus Magnetobacterium bavaricum]